MRLTISVFAILLAGATPATPHHEQGAPPHELRVIRSYAPDLMHRELRRVPVSWSHLRRMVASRWRATHRCQDATLRYRYRRGLATSWQTMLATWRCGGVDAGRISFMTCIAGHEGGREFPDVWNGGARGWPPPPRREANIVLGHLQGRPAWFRGARSGHPGIYMLPDSWDRALWEWAIDPIHQARTFAPLGPGQYATSGMC